MIAPPSGVRIYLACGHTDMRKGMDSLAMLVQQVLSQDPFSGALFAFRGRRADLLKILWYDGRRAAMWGRHTAYVVGLFGGVADTAHSLQLPPPLGVRDRVG